MLFVAKIDERVEAFGAFDIDGAATAPIAAAGAAEGDVALAPERHAAIATCAALNEDFGFVEEFHLNKVTGYRLKVLGFSKGQEGVQ